MSPACQAVARANPNIELADKRRPVGCPLRRRFLFDCADAGVVGFCLVLTVMWQDTGAEMFISGCDINDYAPQSLVDEVRKLSP